MSIWKESGGYRYEFQFKKVRYTRQGYKTKAAARAAREAHRKEVKKNLPPTTGTDFRSLAYEYLDYCQRRYSTKTYKEKRYIYAAFLVFAGNHEIGSYDARAIEGYLQTRHSAANWNKHRKSLCSFFEWAFRRGLVHRNPCAHVGTMPHKAATKVIPSQEDVARLFLASGEFRPFFMALYSLAARVGEINKLRWEDVRFDKRTVTLWTRKGDGSYREQVKALNDELYEELRRLYGKRSGEWVFPNPATGMPYVDRRKQMRRICRTAGISVCGFHSIRHFVASLLADSFKVSLPTIQKMLGHARLTTTQLYIQGLTDGLREAAEKLTISTKPHAAPPRSKKEGSDHEA